MAYTTEKIAGGNPARPLIVVRGQACTGVLARQEYGKLHLEETERKFRF
jgi:hypothetical protein